MKTNVNALKPYVRGVYDVQKLRIMMGNRIVANEKIKMGQLPSEKEEVMDAEGKEILKTLRKHYMRLADAFSGVITRKKFKGDEVIADWTELCLVKQYNDLLNTEEDAFKGLEKALEDYPVWTEFMRNVKGCGPAMAGVIISEINIHKAKYPSSLWKYCGLDVADDGKGRSRRKEHLVESTYKDSEGEEQTKMGITFNPFIKTKLIGVLGSSFLRAGKGGYSDIYYDYKNRLENHPEHSEKSKGHIHNMSIRYMIKIFLVDLHREWRALEGYEATLPYHEAKLGLKHGRAA